MQINTSALEISNRFNDLILTSIQENQTEIAQDIAELSVKTKLNSQENTILVNLVDILI